MRFKRKMKLTKIIPARKKTVYFLWCRKGFLVMGQGFRDARKRLKRKIKACWWCNHKFEDGEMMAMACAEKHGNVIICQNCFKSITVSIDRKARTR